MTTPSPARPAPWQPSSAKPTNGSGSLNNKARCCREWLHPHERALRRCDTGRGGVPALKLGRQLHYQWTLDPVTSVEQVHAHRVNALSDAHRHDSKGGYRFLLDESRDAGEPMADRTAWLIYGDSCW